MVHEDDLEVQYDNNGADVYYYKEVPFTGISREFSASGVMLSEAEYQEGYLTGPLKLWYPSGKIQCEANYLYSLQHGESTDWYENGNVKNKEVLEMGTLLKAIEFDEMGNQIQEFDLERDRPDAYQSFLDGRRIREMYAKKIDEK